MLTSSCLYVSMDKHMYLLHTVTQKTIKHDYITSPFSQLWGPPCQVAMMISSGQIVNQRYFEGGGLMSSLAVEINERRRHTERQPLASFHPYLSRFGL